MNSWERRQKLNWLRQKNTWQQKTKEVSIKSDQPASAIAIKAILLNYHPILNVFLFFLAALLCLKRKKTYESQQEKIRGAMMTIETQVMTLEGANVNLQAMNAMKVGAASMKAMHNDM